MPSTPTAARPPPLPPLLPLPPPPPLPLPPPPPPPLPPPPAPAPPPPPPPRKFLRLPSLRPLIRAVCPAVAATLSTGCATGPSSRDARAFGPLPTRFVKCYDGPARPASTLARVEATSSVV